MKDMRRLATRFEKTAQNFPSMIQLFAITYVFEMRSVDVTMPSFASVVEAALEVSAPRVIEGRENAGWLR